MRQRDGRLSGRVIGLVLICALALGLAGCVSPETRHQQQASFALAKRLRTGPAGFVNDGAGMACPSLNIDCMDPNASVGFSNEADTPSKPCQSIVDWSLKSGLVVYGVDLKSGSFDPVALARPLTRETRWDGINECRRYAITDTFWTGNDQGDPTARLRVAYTFSSYGDPLYATYGSDGSANVYVSPTDLRADVTISDLSNPSKGFLGLFPAKRISTVCFTNHHSGHGNFTIHLLATGAPHPKVTTILKGLGPEIQGCNDVSLPGPTSSLTLLGVTSR